MSKLYMMVGIPASGKSTFCKQKEKEGAVVYATDIIRGELFGDEAIQYTDQWLKENGYTGGDEHFEKFSFANLIIFSILYDRINEALRKGLDVVADATNISKKARQFFLSRCGMNATEIHAVVICTPLEISLERNKNRERTIDENELYRIAGNYEEPTIDEGFTDIEFIGDKKSINYGKSYKE